jgi:hypothetical protein
MFAKAALLSAFVALAATSATAANYEITETVDQSAVSQVDRPVDIIGVVPGMPFKDANAVLVKEYGSDRIMGYTSQVATQELQSQRFDSFYDAENGMRTDQLYIFMTSPISGNRVFAAHRRLEFRVQDGLPKLPVVKDQLIAKYGQPSRTEAGFMYWYLGGDGKCEGSNVCKMLYTNVSDGQDIGTYNPVGLIKKYELAQASGSSVVIVAAISTRRDIADGVQQLDVSFVDLNLLATSARADYDLAMKKQAEFNAGGGAAVPKL